MSRGVPIVGIPQIHDQDLNCDRVEALGIGVRVSGTHFKSGDLVEAVRRVLGEPGYRSNARKYQEILSRYAGARRGAEVIDEYLR
jgi:UDP:flavonoid glycosyltransferase YjiC (YdhE family)